MKRTNLLPAFVLAIVLATSSVHAQEDVVVPQLEEEAPTQGEQFATKLEKSISLTDTIIGRVLESDLLEIPADIEFIAEYMSDSKMTQEQKTRLKTSLDTMSFFFSAENGGSVTPTTFLLATNEVYKELNDFLYEKEQATPAYMYQLRHMARQLQFQVLEGNWKAIEEETADGIVDLVSDIYRNLEDPTVWQKAIRPINDSLTQGVDEKSVPLVYGAAQSYLSVAPLIETATMKKIEKEVAQQEEKKKNNFIIFGIIGTVLVVGILLFIRRRVSI